MDADFSHNPKDIPRLIEAAKEADVVLGSRYVKGGSIENWNIVRRMISYWSNVLGWIDQIEQAEREELFK